ncbi:MAG: formate dehydrogenase [Rhodocyclaceae bacterium]|nr:formate dehydrogenase [Rhodocyclaceae bacterium]
MDIHHLSKMANQIGSFFEAYPDREFAVNEIAGHLRKFWEPRMRETMLRHLDAAKADLHPTVYEAFLRLQTAEAAH